MAKFDFKIAIALAMLVIALAVAAILGYASNYSGGNDDILDSNICYGGIQNNGSNQVNSNTSSTEDSNFAVAAHYCICSYTVP